MIITHDVIEGVFECLIWRHTVNPCTCSIASFPVLPTPAFVLQSLFLHGCETKAGVGRTGSEATCSIHHTFCTEIWQQNIFFLLASVSSLIDQWEKSVNTGFSVGINSLNCVFYREGPRKNNF